MPRRLWHTVTTAITPSLAVGTVCQSPQGTRGAYISTNSQIYNLQSKIEPTAAAIAYRTVVLPQFYRHCDRYWARLTQLAHKPQNRNLYLTAAQWIAS